MKQNRFASVLLMTVLMLFSMIFFAVNANATETTDATDATEAVCDHSDSTHSAATADENGGTHSFTCTVCGEVATEGHTFESTAACILCGAQAVAKVEEAYYGAIGDAFDAWVDGTTLTLLADVPSGSATATCVIDEISVTLDLNGYTLDMSNLTSALQVGSASGSTAALTVCDSGDGGTLKGRINSYGTIAMSGGNVTKSGIAVYVYAGGSFTMTGGNISGYISNYGTVSIGGGSVTYTTYSVYNYTGSTFTLTGGTLSGGIYNQGTVIMSGGSVTTSSSYDAVYMASSNAKLEISGGSLKGRYGIYVYTAGATITIIGDPVIEGTSSGIYASSRKCTVTVNGTPTIKGNSGSGIYVTYSTASVSICDSPTITGSNHGVYCTGTLTISDNPTITGNSSYGVHATGTLNISGNPNITGGSRGINSSAATTITGSPTISTTNGYGMYISGSKNVSLNGELSISGTTSGIYYSGSGVLTISGNTKITATSGSGVQSSGSKSISLNETVTIVGATHGIYHTGSAALTISGTPSITANDGYAIYASTTSSFTLGGAPTLYGTVGTLYVKNPVTLTSVPNAGWLVDMSTPGVFATPGEGVALDISMFAPVQEGYSVYAVDNSLALCSHALENYSSNNDNTHTATCDCGSTSEIQDCAGGTATCINKAVCTSCAVEYGQVNTDNHVGYAYSGNGDGTHTGVCECGDETDALSCSGGTATCSKLAVCSTCGQSYGETNPSNHTYSSNVCTGCGIVGGTSGNIKWTLVDGCLYLTGTGAMNNYSSASNQPWKNYATQIYSIVVGEGITTIGNYAFEYCYNISQVTFPDGLTSIGTYAFNMTNLVEVVLPDTVTTIGTNCFGHCDNLKSVTLSDGITTISEGAFFSADALTTVVFPANLVNIDRMAFANCRSLGSITIPKTVTSIDEGIWSGCASLLNIYVEDGNTAYKSVDGVLFTADGSTLVSYPMGRVGPYTVPDGTVTIADSAFKFSTEYGADYTKYSGLTAVYFPDSLTTIEDDAFAYNINLTYVNLANVETLGEDVFCHCTALSTVIFGENISSLGATIFYISNGAAVEEIYFTGDAPTFNSTALKFVTASVYYPSDNDTWTSVIGSAYGGDSITWVSYDPSVTTGSGSYGNANEFSWILDASGKLTVTGIGSMPDDVFPAPWFNLKEHIKSVEISDGITHLGAYSFYRCVNLTQITIPSSVTSIGLGAMCYCTKLESVDLPIGLTSIEGNAFRGTALKEIEIPDTCLTLGASAFRECRLLQSVIFSENLTTIPNYCFSDCFSLATLELPDALTAVNLCAFQRCYSLKEVTLPASLEEYGYGAFNVCINLENIYVDEANEHLVSADGVLYSKDLTVLYQYPSARNGAYRVLDGCETIYYFAFRHAIGLTELYTPDSLTSILQQAFQGCDNLNKIVLGKGVDVLEYLAFHTYDYNRSYRQVYFTGDVPSSIAAKALFGYTSSFYAQAYFPADNDSWTSDAMTGIEDNNNFSSVVWSSHAHSYESVVTAPTCAEAGYTTYTCSVCGHSYTGDEVAATGDHNYVDCVCTVCGMIGGICGDNLFWTLDDGVLTIFGTGEMYNYGSIPSGTNLAPWNAYREQVTDIVIGEEVTYLGNFAFVQFTALAEVTIPDNVTSLGTNLFRDCTALTAVDFGSGVTAVSNYMFYGCTTLEALDIPAHITSLGVQAFRGCGLVEFTIPDTVTSIGERLLQGCRSLNKVTVGNGINSLSNYMFYFCQSLTDVTLPEGLTSLGTYTFYHCDALTSFIVPEVETIGNFTFAYCVNLAEVRIPDSVNTIGKYAFTDCTSLATVIFEGDAPSIATNAFAEDVATAYYDCDAAWTSDNLTNYGGTLTWILQHSYSSVVTAPTCTEAGYTTYTCSVCGDTNTGDTVDALGHTVEAVPGKAATCTETGLTDGVKCSVCREIITAQEEIPSLGHTKGEAVNENLVDATSTTAGSYDSVVYCTECGHEISRVEVIIPQILKVNSVSLSLQNCISINFISRAKSYGYTNPYLVVIRGNEETVITEYTIDENNRYVFVFETLPQYLNDKLEIYLYANYNGEACCSDKLEYSITKYCYSQLSKTTDTKLQTMLVDLLNYGAAAQIYRNHNVENLANADLTDEQAAWGTQNLEPKAADYTVCQDTKYAVIDNPTAAFKSVRLVLDNSVAVRFTATLPSDITGITLKATNGLTEWTVPSTEFTYDASTGRYVILFEELAAHQMDDQVLYTFYDGDTVISNTFCYSIESYVGKNFDSLATSDPALLKVLIEMMDYGRAANAYK